MTSKAILLLVAGVLSAEGELARIDTGRAAGLRVGDRGLVFYELKVREESRRVEVGRAEVVTVDEATASIDVAGSAEVRAGYRVEFSLPAARLVRPAPAREPPAPPAELTDLRRRLAAADARIADLQAQARAATERNARLEGALAESLARSARLEERAAAAESSGATHESTLEEARVRLAEALAEQDRQRSEYRASAAAAEGRAALLMAELEAAKATLAELKSAPAPAPAPEPAPEQAPAPDLESASAQADTAAPAPALSAGTQEESMAHVVGGEYQVGRSPAQASFYNQTPRFTERLQPFWVDVEPVESAAYEVWRGSTPVAVAARFQSGVTFAEALAYCRAHGKRLPTEVEWEVAMTVGQLESVPSLLEWTASWYQPYPNNSHPEADYGERFRVVRTSDGDRYERRYLVPGSRDSAVGFRCVRGPSAAP